MTSDAYVLLYECDADDYGYESVRLRFLPFSHPFGTLLLHKGSRQAAEMQYYEQDIWRLHIKSYQPWTPPDMEAYLRRPAPGERLQAGIHYPGTLFVDEQRWRRKHVCWSSVYGAPSELHLLLNDSIQAWVAQQQALNPHLGIFDSPKTLVGALRLDSDVNGSEAISRDISDRTMLLTQSSMILTAKVAMPLVVMTCNIVTRKLRVTCAHLRMLILVWSPQRSLMVPQQPSVAPQHQPSQLLIILISVKKVLSATLRVSHL